MTRDDLTRRLAVYLVADPEQTERDLVDDVLAALRGGVTCVQLRAKRLTDHDVVVLALRLRELCHDYGALFLVNDRVDIALITGADGVHLGVSDRPVCLVRRLIGDDLLVGYSPETDEQAETASRAGADYLGVGPVFGTASKADAGEAIGVGTVARRARIAGIPVIGIGGITAGNAASVIAAGAVGVAVVGAILHASDPEPAARQLTDAVLGAAARR